MEEIQTILISAGVSFIAVSSLALLMPCFEGVLGGKLIVLGLGVIFLILGLKLHK